MMALFERERPVAVSEAFEVVDAELVQEIEHDVGHRCSRCGSHMVLSL